MKISIYKKTIQDKKLFKKIYEWRGINHPELKNIEEIQIILKKEE